MNCKIDNANIKVFVKLLQTLSKLGHEIVMESYDDHLCLRVVNERSTGFAVCKIVTAFFKEYESIYSPENNPFICKMLIKHVLGVFKNMKHLEKQIEVFGIESETESTFLIFKFKYKCESSKTQKIFLTEGEFLRISTPDEDRPNIISGSATLFGNILTNFQHSDEEITFNIKKTSVVVRNYHSEEPVARKTLNSYYTLSTKAFDCYNVKGDCQITFPMKPFRAAVQLAEFIHSPVHMSFQKPGLPIVIQFSKNNLFEIAFTFSTMVGSDGTYGNKNNYNMRRIPLSDSQTVSLDSTELSLYSLPPPSANPELAKQLRYKRRAKVSKPQPVKKNVVPSKEETSHHCSLEDLTPLVQKPRDSTFVKEKNSQNEIEHEKFGSGNCSSCNLPVLFTPKSLTDSQVAKRKTRSSKNVHQENEDEQSEKNSLDKMPSKRMRLTSSRNSEALSISSYPSPEVSSIHSRRETDSESQNMILQEDFPTTEENTDSDEVSLLSLSRANSKKHKETAPSTNEDDETLTDDTPKKTESSEFNSMTTFKPPSEEPYEKTPYELELENNAKTRAERQWDYVRKVFKRLYESPEKKEKVILCPDTPESDTEYQK